MKDFLVRQDDENDCGACSLSSIIKYYNGFVPLEIIKSDTNTTKNGTNFYNIKIAAFKYGLNALGIKEKNVEKIKIPCIAQLKINNLYHFIVIYKITSKYIIIMDPENGIIKYTREEFNYYFTGNILFFEKINDVAKYKKNNYFLKNIRKTLIDNISLLLLILFFGLISIIISFLIYYFIKPSQNYNIKTIVIIFSSILSFRCLCNYIKSSLVTHLNKKINISLLTNYVKKIFSIPFKYTQLKSEGDIAARINDLNEIKDIIIPEFINIIIYSISIIISLIILLKSDLLLTLIIVIITIIYFIINILYSKKIYRDFKKNIESNDILLSNLVEYTSKIKTIKNLNKEKLFYQKLNNDIIYNCKENKKISKLINKLNLIKDMYSDISILLIIIILIKNDISSLLFYMLYHNYFLDSINYFASIIPIYTYIKSTISKLNEIYYLEDENKEKGKVTNFDNIEISNLAYNVGTNKLFDGFNLKINAKEKVLLIGTNGSGKSTLLNILFKNISNYTGKIKIGNEDLNNINLEILKTNISYISQNDVLFNDTIKNNIILDEIYDESKLNKIIKILDIDKMLNKKNINLDHFYKNNLSGGEKQLIILARGLYRNFKILFLDEALNQISHYSRIKIINDINYFYKDKIIIYVSHNYEKYPFDKIINLTARKEN